MYYVLYGLVERDRELETRNGPVSVVKFGGVIASEKGTARGDQDDS